MVVLWNGEKEWDVKYIFQMQTKARVTCQMEFIAMQQHIFSSLVNYRHEVQQILHSIIDLHIITLRQIPWLTKKRADKMISWLQLQFTPEHLSRLNTHVLFPASYLYGEVLLVVKAQEDICLLLQNVGPGNEM